MLHYTVNKYGHRNIKFLNIICCIVSCCIYKDVLHIFFSRIPSSLLRVGCKVLWINKSHSKHVPVCVIFTHFRLSFVASIPTFTKINYPRLDKIVGFWLVNDPWTLNFSISFVVLFFVVVFIRTFYIFFSQEFRPPFSVWDAKCFNIMSLTCIAT
jgi:hypothetical protein